MRVRSAHLHQNFQQFGVPSTVVPGTKIRVVHMACDDITCHALLHGPCQKDASTSLLKCGSTFKVSPPTSLTHAVMNHRMFPVGRFFHPKLASSPVVLAVVSLTGASQSSWASLKAAFLSDPGLLDQAIRPSRTDDSGKAPESLDDAKTAMDAGDTAKNDLTLIYAVYEHVVIGDIAGVALTPNFGGCV